MDQQRRDEFKQKLYDLTPTDGSAIGNAAIRQALQAAYPSEQFTLDDYWDLRNSLITDGKLLAGKGRGGSVRRVLTAGQPAAPPPPAAESSLYEPFRRCIQTGYVADNFLKPWVCEITAFKGSKNTEGYGPGQT